MRSDRWYRLVVDRVGTGVARPGRSVGAAVGAGAATVVCVGGLLATTWPGRAPAPSVGLDAGRTTQVVDGPAARSPASGLRWADTRPGPPGVAPAAEPGAAASMTYPPPIPPRAPLPGPGTRPSTPPRPIPPLLPGGGGVAGGA